MYLQPGNDETHVMHCTNSTCASSDLGRQHSHYTQVCVYCVHIRNGLRDNLKGPDLGVSDTIEDIDHT